MDRKKKTPDQWKAELEKLWAAQRSSTRKAQSEAAAGCVTLNARVLPVSQLATGCEPVHIFLDGHYLGLFRLEGHGPTLYIADFHIRHDRQRQGFGSEALRQLIALARAACYATVAGTIEGEGLERVEELTRFYTRAGFTVGIWHAERNGVGFSMTLATVSAEPAAGR